MKWFARFAVVAVAVLATLTTGSVLQTSDLSLASTRAQGVPYATSYFDDFSAYPVGQPPAGWTEYGSSYIAPTIEEVGGTGPEYRLLSFPLSPATYQEKYLIKDGLEFETGSATTKINFQISRDEAGLVLAYNDPGNHIRVAVNPFWDDMTIWEVVGGELITVVGTGRGNLPISLYTDYWLRVAITPGGPDSGNTLTAYWSTDGNNFTSLLTVPDLANSRGGVGYITWSFVPPHVHFDDFRVLAEEETAPLIWTDLGEAAPGESSINALIGAPGDRIVGGTYGTGTPYLFDYDISSATFTPKMRVPGTGAYVDRLALGSGDQAYVTTSRTFGQGNLASYDPTSRTFVDLGAFGDEYGHGLAVGLDGKVYVGTCCQGQFSIYDPQTQSWTYMGRIISNQRRITGLTVGSDGNIYGVTSRIWVYPYGSVVLFKFDPVSQSTTVIGTIWAGVHESWNIVANPSDGRLYGSVGYGMTPRLFVFDPADPQLGIQDLGETVVGADQISPGALIVAPDGKVYAIAGGRIVVYDPSDPDVGIVDLGPVGEGSAPFALGTDGRLYAVSRTDRTHLVRSDLIVHILAEEAAELAKAVVGQPYIRGGKGWDFTERLFVGPEQIGLGYHYWNAALKQITFGRGLDCSGLVLWSYNRAYGATKFLEGNPIRYEGADGQYRNNSHNVNESDLRPGDLLFFDRDDNGVMDHVAMYVGGNGQFDVVHASGPGVGIILSKRSELEQSTGFVGFRRRTDPKVGFEVRTNSPIELVVTDPDGFTITADTLVTNELEILREIPGVLYYLEDGNLDDIVIAPELKIGAYLISVVPEANASPTDAYGLEVEATGTIITLAQDVLIRDIPSQGYGIRSTGTEIIPFILVTIDIKPGSDPNSINCNNENGVITVAILTTETFDATTVDHTTVTFEGASETHVDRRTGESVRHEEDMDGDGDIDLVFHFRLGDTNLTCDSTEGMLMGKTLEGLNTEGTDSIRMIDRGGGRP